MEYISFLKEYTVQIPKIQREYVQGQNEKGEKFAVSIFKKLTENPCKKNLSLDLVFGSVKNKYEDGKVIKVFEPVDGQQRLTTLFLLYWYIGYVEHKTSEISVLSKFSYETRKSSKEFCFELSNTADKKMNFEEEPSIVIKSQSWYYSKYDCDYTVQSMLNMLDTIHRLYSDAKEKCETPLFKNLNRIEFDFIPMNDFNLGEELYTIMNDRGKPLTTFENFKSSLNKWMTENKTQEIRDYFLEKVNSKPRYLRFFEKLDNVWSEKLWLLNNKCDSDTDSAFYKFFCRYTWVNYVTQGKNIDKGIEDILHQEDEDAYDFDKFEKVLNNLIGEVNKAELFFDNLTKYLDFMLDKANEKIISDFLTAPWALESCANILGLVSKYDSSISDEEDDSSNSNLDAQDVIVEGGDKHRNYAMESVPRAVNYALQLYIENNSTINEKALNDWKRVVWNWVEVGRAKDQVKTAKNIMKKMFEYRKDTGNIIKKLANTPLNSIMPDYEMYEIRKALWINHDENWSTSFEEAEKHAYFKGYIDFLVKDYNNDNIQDTIENFKARHQLASAKIFSNCGLCTENNHLVLRALLSRTDSSVVDELMNKDDSLVISSSEYDRSNLKTQIKSTWKPILIGYLENCSKENIIAQMEEDCKNRSDWKDFEFWHEKLCTNTELINHIQSLSLDNSKTRPRLWFNKDISSVRIEFGTRKCARIYLDNDITLCVDRLMDCIQQLNIDSGFIEKHFHKYDDNGMTYYYIESGNYFLWCRFKNYSFEINHKGDLKLKKSEKLISEISIKNTTHDNYRTDVENWFKENVKL